MIAIRQSPRLNWGRKTQRVISILTGTPATSSEQMDDDDACGLRNETNATGWTNLVKRIESYDDGAMSELYRIFGRGVRYSLCRQLGPQELDDKVHDTFVIVVQAIQRGELRDPERLMGFVRTVVRRQIASYIDEVVHSRREELNFEIGACVPDQRRNPEQNVVLRQKIELMREVLDELGERDREILTRFYLQEETQEEICDDMDLSETQFRLLKSRAKARFGEIGRKKLQQRALVQIFLRASGRGRH